MNTKQTFKLLTVAFAVCLIPNLANAQLGNALKKAKQSVKSTVEQSERSTEIVTSNQVVHNNAPLNVSRGNTIYVSVETGGSFRSADGSKEKPYKDLQVALDKATAGSTILVAKGNYLGSSDQGYLQMKVPVSIIGGFTTDFSSRDVVNNRTMIQPTAASNGTSGSNALLSLGDKNKMGPANFKSPGIVIDGIIFDRGFSNGYHPTKGKPEGVETGMLINQPGQGINGSFTKVITTQKPLVYLCNGTGDVTIQNCVFTNSGFYAILGSWAEGNWKIHNNLFVNNTYAAVEINASQKEKYCLNVDFAFNTMLFSWSRTNDLESMGYGYRFSLGVNTDVHHNILGCSVLGALDRGRVDQPNLEKIRKTGVENNTFFLNRQGDMIMPSGGGLWRNVRCSEFEDIEELYKYEGNKELPASELKGKINEAYLEGFISMNYSESVDYDPNSAAN